MLCAKYNLQSEQTFETPCKCRWSGKYSEENYFLSNTTHVNMSTSKQAN